jgi:hypothetical protein
MEKYFFFVFVVFLGGLTLQTLVPGPETTLAQAGDPVFVGAGDIAACNQTRDEATARLLDGIDGVVFTLGDNVYRDGALPEFTDCYHANWGRHKARTRPVPGNHDYHTEGAAGYYTYYGAAASPLDHNCTSDCQGYYSYDLGAWRIIALNSEISHSTTSAQVQWLRAELAANPRKCTLAYWHRPRFSSGRHGSSAGMQPFWQALYEFEADVVLSGHDHLYERFAPQDPDGQADLDGGIRQFTVGTGGAGLYAFDIIHPNSEVRNNATWGVLKLTLHAASYDWEFIPVAGQTFSDVGSAGCVGAGPSPTPTRTSTASPTPTTTPTATLSSTATTSPTPTNTASPTNTATSTPTPSATPTLTPTGTNTPTNTPTATATNTATSTATNSVTPTPAGSPPSDPATPGAPTPVATTTPQGGGDGQHQFLPMIIR